MRIVVTGGAGYIGSVITEELLRANHEVTVLDNLSKGHRGAVPNDVHFVQLDLLEESRVRQVLIDRKIEAVIHMAASSLVGESVQNPALYYENNVMAGLRLLNAMREANVSHIVFSSTAAVYGEPKKQPIEEDDPQIPTNPYGESKLAFQRILHWYHRAYGMTYVSLRYFNAAGATEKNGEVHDPETHLIPAILQVAAGKRPYLEVFGNDYETRDGTCLRDYIHVIDLAQAHILALDRSILSDGYNLGCGGNGYSVKEVLDIARKVTKHPIPEKYVARRPGDPPVLIASSEKIKRELGWKPRLQNLETIIESAWRWMQNHPDGYT
jgi:UDP-glucose 4-epimerase